MKTIMKSLLLMIITVLSVTFAHKLPNIEYEDRVFGGQAAEPKAYPYQVGLSITRSGSQSWCGGALISDRFVVTAAHCIDKAKKAKVILGGHDRLDDKESGRVNQIVKHSNFVIHKKWDSKNIRNDIALIKLNEAVKITDQIKPVLLPSRAQESHDFEGADVTAIGWGHFDSSKKLARILRYANSQVLKQSKCSDFFKNSLQPTNICFDGSSKRATCNGDSGGPMITKSENDEPMLIGLTSFGSAKGCGKGRPTVFTRITSYLDWISDKTGIKIE